MPENLSLSEIIKIFENPLIGSGIIHWCNFSGEITHDRIISELDYVSNLGIRQILIAAGYNVEPRYLSDEWFEIVCETVYEAKKRNIKVWIADEGTYPSGFAGETFTTKYPHKRMKAIVVEKEFVFEGNLCNITIDSKTIGILAKDLNTNKYFSFEKAELETNFLFLPYKSLWQIKVIASAFRTSPTRYIHNPTGQKDTTYSLCDYLDAEAVNIFINEVYERYEKYLKDEFGQTVIGFFADEPDYSISGIPYTDEIFEMFNRQKGYDIRKYIPCFFKDELDPETKMVKADYWEVWSNLFANCFFNQIYKWCEKNKLKFVVHLNHEDKIDELIKSEGQFFAHMKYVHIPAFDVIWRQIWYDKKVIFPKYASSVSHIKDVGYTFSESFAVYGRGISVSQIKWVIDYQLLMDTNLFLTSIFKFLNYHPQECFFPEVIGYTNVLSSLLSLSKSCSKVLLYFPTDNMWAEEKDVEQKIIEIGNYLLEKQIDFDFFDLSLLEFLDISEGKIYNKSRQGYDTVVIPPLKYISAQLLKFLKTFYFQGGRVIFIEAYPQFIYSNTFTQLIPFIDKKIGEVAEVSFLQNLIEKDFFISPQSDKVRILKKEINDNILYLFFNNSAEHFSGKVSFKTNKKYVYLWDEINKRILEVNNIRTKDNYIEFYIYVCEYQLLLFIVSNERLKNVQKAFINTKPLQTIEDLSFDWKVLFDKKSFSLIDLKDWATLGFGDYSGRAVYKKNFVLKDLECIKDRRLVIYCPNIKYSANLWLNKNYIGARIYPPFMWDITHYIKKGENELVIEVQNTLAPSFLGTTEKIEKLKKEAERNFYLSISLDFDLEMLTSGLLPPVLLIAFEG